jgi:hypothetical protein
MRKKHGAENEKWKWKNKTEYFNLGHKELKISSIGDIEFD